MALQPNKIRSKSSQVTARLAMACAVLLTTLSAAGPMVVGRAIAQSGSAGQRGLEQEEVPISPAQLGTYHAFVVGIDEYKQWPDLRFAERDAEEIKALLIDKYGFESKNVIHLRGAEASKRGIENGLNGLLGRLSENDNLLIYYAGHGQLDPLADSGYWIPADGGLNDQSSWIPFSRVRELLSASAVKARHIVLITDSCYGGAIRGVPVLDPSDRTTKALLQDASKKSREVIASGGLAPVPDRSEFAKLLKDALRENTRPIIDLESLFWSKVYVPLKELSSGDQDPFMAPIKTGAEFEGKFVLFQAVASQQPPGQPPQPESAGKVRILSFDASPQHVPPGGQATLTWQVDGADSVKLTGFDTVGMKGTRVVKASETTTYELTATQRDGLSVTSKLTVFVDTPPAVIVTFEAWPARIARRGYATLKWETENAQDIQISDIGSVSASGARDVQPRETTTYTLEARNRSGQSVKRTVQVAVEARPDPVIVSFEADPPGIRPGQRTSLRWKVENAVRVEVTGIGPVSSDGTRSVTPASTTRYMLSAFNEDNRRVSSTIIVRVDAAAIEVPSVIGQAELQAAQTLGNAGLAVGRTQQRARAGAAPGTILDQRPAPGSKVDPGTRVDLMVVAQTAIELARGRFSFPGDGVKNQNNAIGPFCCTGETATIMTNRGTPAGYVYFFDFPGGGRAVGGRAAARSFAVGISGLSRLADSNSQRIVQWVRFAADELKRGQSKEAVAGGLRYKVSVVGAETTNLGGTTFYFLDSVKIVVGVSAA